MVSIFYENIFHKTVHALGNNYLSNLSVILFIIFNPLYKSVSILSLANPDEKLEAIDRPKVSIWNIREHIFVYYYISNKVR